MLQQFEYDPNKLVKWIFTMPDLKNVINRGKLVITAKSLVLLLVGYVIYLSSLLLGLYSLVSGNYVVALILIFFSFDFSWIGLYVISYLGKIIINVKRAPLMNEAESKFESFEGQKIAILGSYGKTSMKELLSSVLSEKFNVSYTPGNKNVPISHARWITKEVKMDEDFLIIEYGEGEPGDIRRLVSLSKPNIAIMTGLAPNHLDHYKTLDNLMHDFLEIEDFANGDRLYVNRDSEDLISRLKNKAILYSEKEVDGWSVSSVDIQVNQTAFMMKKGPVSLKLTSGLVGRHNVGPLALVCAFAYRNGMNKEEIEIAVSKTKPFEHRMEPRSINGAWIVDDTYNGNMEGFRSGIRFLKELSANSRKIYVTPGLVDQGEENDRVHKEIAFELSKSNFDQIVLMDNPNTKIIKGELDRLDYMGNVELERNPLAYYQNIDQFIASGDIVLMQNDLPDAYGS